MSEQKYADSMLRIVEQQIHSPEMQQWIKKAVTSSMKKTIWQRIAYVFK